MVRQMSQSVHKTLAMLAGVRSAVFVCSGARASRLHVSRPDPIWCSSMSRSRIRAGTSFAVLSRRLHDSGRQQAAESRFVRCRKH